MIMYSVKFLQLLCFGMYLIHNEEKKVKKFERGLNSRIQIMVSCFDIQDLSELVDRASIYEESLMENTTKYTDQKRKAQGFGVLVGGAGLATTMAIESSSPQRSQRRTSGNPPVLPPRSQISELCRKCN